MMTAVSLLTIGFYLAATSRLSFLRGNRTQPNDNHRLFLALGLSAVLLHALLLYYRIHGAQGFISLGLLNAMSMIAWLLAIFVLFITWLRGLANLALVLFPLAAFNILLEMFLTGSTRLLPENLPAGVTFHILISMFAYSLLSLAALQALFMAVQDYYLRHKKPLKVMRHLPPLQVMETLLFQMLGIGFLLLTLSLLSGALFLQDIFAQHLAHKTLLSLLAWLIFATLLWGRHQYGWRGRRVLYLLLGGFLMLMLAYFGSKLVLELILARVK